MSSRESILAISFLVALLFGGGGFAGYALVYSPLQDKKTAIDLLQGEIDGGSKEGLAERVEKMRKSAAQLPTVKAQSLPANLDSKAQYKRMLEHLLQQAKITDYTLPDAKPLDTRTPITPELAPKKPAYTRLEFRIDMRKANVWQLTDFLYGFYQVDLLHQITSLNVIRENNTTESRNGLTVHITIEAITIDGAEARSALFPVNPLAGTNASPGKPVVPILAIPYRDYSLIPLRDLFYGPLPQDKTPPGITIAKISNVEIIRGEKVPDVKVKLTGDGAEEAKLTASASGSLLPEGNLKVDPKTYTISFPTPNSDVTDYASSTISLVATGPNGKEYKGSFKISIQKSDTKLPHDLSKEDVSGSIKLTIISGNSDGSTTALIRDMANPFRYEVTTKGKNIEVIKWWPSTATKWKKDLDYEHPPGILAFSDETSSTKRTLRVVAIEPDGLIVADLSKPDPKADAKQPGKGFRPGGGGDRPPKTPVDPLAVVAGNLAVAIPTPTLYRWTTGKSLLDLAKAKISPDEAKKILQRVATEGPVAGVALSGGN